MPFSLFKQKIDAQQPHAIYTRDYLHITIFLYGIVTPLYNMPIQICLYAVNILFCVQVKHFFF